MCPLIPWWLASHPQHTPLHHPNMLQYADLIPIHPCLAPWAYLYSFNMGWAATYAACITFSHGSVPCVMKAWFMGVWRGYAVCKLRLLFYTWFICVSAPGRFIPSCDEDGYYRKQQCDKGECWCADQNGGEVAGSRIRGKPDCGESCRFQLYIFMNRI